MWALCLIGGALVAGKLLFGEWAEEEQRRRMQLRQRREEVNAEGTRAFWHTQVGEVGQFSLKGMPKGPALLAQLSSVVEDCLILCDENDNEVARVSMWDVEAYEVFDVNATP